MVVPERVALAAVETAEGRAVLDRSEDVADVAVDQRHVVRVREDAALGPADRVAADDHAVELEPARVERRVRFGAASQAHDVPRHRGTRLEGQPDEPVVVRARGGVDRRPLVGGFDDGERVDQRRIDPLTRGRHVGARGEDDGVAVGTLRRQLEVADVTGPGIEYQRRARLRGVERGLQVRAGRHADRQRVGRDERQRERRALRVDRRVDHQRAGRGRGTDVDDRAVLEVPDGAGRPLDAKHVPGDPAPILLVDAALAHVPPAVRPETEGVVDERRVRAHRRCRAEAGDHAPAGDGRQLDVAVSLDSLDTRGAGIGAGAAAAALLNRP